MAKEQDQTWRLVGLSFLVGAIVDGVFGVAILSAGELFAPVMRVTLPNPRVYFDLNGLFLIFLGLFYVCIWREPRRLAPIAAAATLLRFGGFALFGLGVALGRAEPTFVAIALLDGTLALVHLVFLRRAAGSLWSALTKRWPLDPDSGGAL